MVAFYPLHWGFGSTQFYIFFQKGLLRGFLASSSSQGGIIHGDPARIGYNTYFYNTFVLYGRIFAMDALQAEMAAIARAEGK